MSKSKSIGEYKARSIILHGASNFDYSLWPSNIVNNKARVTTICPLHGRFEQSVTKHATDGRGCRKCGRDSFRLKVQKDTSHYISRAKEKHNGFYNYDKVPTGHVPYSSKVIVTCPVHGDYLQRLEHIPAYGCRKCSSGGFSPEKCGYIYFLRGEQGFVKVGITNDITKRVRFLRKETPFSFDVLGVFHHIEGSHVEWLEAQIKQHHATAGLKGFNGATEWLNMRTLDVLLLPEFCGFTVKPLS